MAKSIHAPVTSLKNIPITWPFARWGMDLLGPFPACNGGCKYLVVTIDYFSKWIEAMPLGKITSQAVQNFFWQNIICRYGVPRELTVDNGKQFDCAEFIKFCECLEIKMHFASVAYPKSNGACERANGLILQGLRRRVEHTVSKARGAWGDELASVVWGIRTSVSRSTGRTPFSLVYGAEAVLPAEVEFRSPRIERLRSEEHTSELQSRI